MTDTSGTVANIGTVKSTKSYQPYQDDSYLDLAKQILLISQ